MSLLLDYLSQNPRPLDGSADGDFLGSPQFRMLANRWRGHDWEQRLIWVQPEEDIRSSLAILYLTGGEPNPLDLEEAKDIAHVTKCPVALLHDVPVQPLYERFEDELIAYTFDQYIEQGDPDWPILLPMTQGAIAAMDLVQDFTQNTINRFLVTGLSKRGWTTWLAAASKDPRVVGIAPAVFDTLNFSKQMHHQLELWGHYSEMVEPYSRYQLQERSESAERGRLLSAAVDPFTYREAMSQPTTVISGTNDPYWAIDALSLYWDDLSMPKWACAIPNAPHNLGKRIPMHRCLAAMADQLNGGISLPRPNWTWGQREVAFEGEADVYQLWEATSDNWNFTEAVWRKVDSKKTDTGFALKPVDRPTARLIEFVYYRGHYDVSFTSTVQAFHP